MLKTLIKQIGSFKTASILTPIFISLEVVMGVLIPYVTSWIIDEGIAKSNLGNVYKYGAIMLVLAAMSMIFGILAGRFSAMASSGFARNLRDAMFRNIQTFSFSNIDKFSSSGLVTRMTTDVNNLQNAFQMLLRISVRAPLNLVFSILMCVFINTKMSSIFIIALVILGTVLYLIVSRTVKLFTQVFKKYDDLNNVVQENVSAIRVVKAFVREDYENKKFSKAARALYSLFVKTESLMALNHPVMMIVVYGCIISLSWFGAKNIVAGDLTTGQLTSLFTYVMTILSALMMLSMIFVQLTMSAASGKRVAEVINEKADIVNPENPVMTVADGSIDFDNVDFTYKKVSAKDLPLPSSLMAGLPKTDKNDGDYAVSGINLHINSGETIGIIGGTGCGKSTLAMLISRMYDVTHGSIKVGGVDVRDYDLEALRNNVSMVLQQNVLFSGTVLDNLRWGKNDATLEECKHACKLACADEFIEEMPDGYDSVIEQGGTNVSGGQKQRLCIARALLKSPKVLVLDDSTSACDTATDARINKALRDYMPEVTKVIVAQRVHSVMHANRIIVMDSGQINGIGTHEQLLQDNKIYQEIHKLQIEAGGDFDPKQ